MSPSEEVEIFFQQWDNAFELQLKYVNRIKELTSIVREIHKENYKPLFHNQLIKELARSEIICEHYQFMISNDREESPNAIFALKNERQQMNKLRDQLQLDIKGARTAKKEDRKDDDAEGSVSKSARNSLIDMIKKARDVGDLNITPTGG